MKILSILFCLIFLMCCSQEKQNNSINSQQQTIIENDEVYGERLIEKGYLKFANPKKNDSLEFGIKSTFDLYDEEIYRFARIDAEELIEYHFDFFLPELNIILAKRDIQLKIQTTKNYEITNDIIVNGEILNLYTKRELDDKSYWETGPKNLFTKINQILLKNKSDEKFYLIYGGNDLSALLLTDSQFQIIKEKYRNNSKEIPYLP